jgi:cell division protein FtsQ
MQRVTYTRKRAERGAAAKSARRAAPGGRLALRRPVVSAAAGLAVLAAIVVWRGGWIDDATARAERTLLSASTGVGLTVREVLLEGRRYAPRSRIAAAVGVRRGEPLLGVDLRAIRQRLEAVSWVRAASVRRDWPSRIRVVIDERRPVALWQRDGALHLVDAEGVTLTDRNVGRFRHLLVIVGKDAPIHTPDLLDTLETEPSLKARVLAAVRVGARRWDIRFKSGVDVRLP